MLQQELVCNLKFGLIAAGQLPISGAGLRRNQGVSLQRGR
jgi:hypothetical protein